MTTEQIKARYSNRYEYFKLCCDVSQARETQHEGNACLVLRKVMIALGYPSETATWDNQRTLMYADNIVCMG